MFRLVGLLGGLSVAMDLGTGSPLEESLQRCLVATRLARTLGCTDDEVREVLYTALLEHLGCTAYAHEGAQLFGDDIATVRLNFLTDFTDPMDVWRTWAPGIAKARGGSRIGALATTLANSRKVESVAPPATCEVARDAARALGLSAGVQTNLAHVTAMWNAKGYPAVGGDEVPRGARIMAVASTAVLFCLHAGAGAAAEQVRRRAGSHLDPTLAEAFLDDAAGMLAGLGDLDAFRAVLDAEPDPVSLVGDEQVEQVARTFGHLVDLKTPSLHGHSTRVGDLAAEAARCHGLRDDVRTLRLAGYLHDIGRIGVSSRIWARAGPLSETEREQARLHPYHSERILSRVPELGAVATMAGQHHERCDGSGYHRGIAHGQLSPASRLLAAADTYCTLVEGRPHRPAQSADRAAARLTEQARQGRLDPDAVAAVLQAAGHRSGTRPARPAGLTERQVGVLRLVAAGLSNAEIARALVISRRTAEHHVQDVYAKIGVSTRPGAALFAMEHGLLEPVAGRRAAGKAG